MKSPVELNGLFLKFFCHITWFDKTWHWTPCKQSFYVKPCCFYIINKLHIISKHIRYICIYIFIYIYIQVFAYIYIYIYLIKFFFYVWIYIYIYYILYYIIYILYCMYIYLYICLFLYRWKFQRSKSCWH